MENIIANRFYLLLVFILSGILIGILFDIFRILRRSFKTPDFVTYIQDILFWMITGCFLLFIIFKFNNGEIRAYLFLGLIIGILLYLFTVSRYFIKISVTIIQWIKSIIEKILSILLFPFRWIFSILKKFFFKPISFCIINIKKNMTNFIKNIKSCVKLPKISKKKKKNVAEKKEIGI